MRMRRLARIVGGFVGIGVTTGVTVPPPPLPPQTAKFQPSPHTYSTILRHDQQVIQARHAATVGNLHRMGPSVWHYSIGHPVVLGGAGVVLFVWILVLVRYERGRSASGRGLWF